jgi:hypothetical protein
MFGALELFVFSGRMATLVWGSEVFFQPASLLQGAKRHCRLRIGEQGGSG